jgi:hypothetical protein
MEDGITDSTGVCFFSIRQENRRGSLPACHLYYFNFLSVSVFSGVFSDCWFLGVAGWFILGYKEFSMSLFILFLSCKLVITEKEITPSDPN